MQVLPVDLTELAAVILGISVVLIPVLGLTARFALSPVVKALATTFEARESAETLRILQRRLELQEQEIAVLTQTVRALEEGRDFDRRLGAPRGADASTPPAARTETTVGGSAAGAGPTGSDAGSDAGRGAARDSAG